MYNFQWPWKYKCHVIVYICEHVCAVYPTKGVICEMRVGEIMSSLNNYIAFLSLAFMLENIMSPQSWMSDYVKSCANRNSNQRFKINKVYDLLMSQVSDIKVKRACGLHASDLHLHDWGVNIFKNCDNNSKQHIRNVHVPRLFMWMREILVHRCRLHMFNYSTAINLFQTWQYVYRYRLWSCGEVSYELEIRLWRRLSYMLWVLVSGSARYADVCVFWVNTFFCNPEAKRENICE